MKVRLKAGAAPIVFGAFSAPSHPHYFEVPRLFTAGALRAIEAGQLEYAPREEPAAPAPAPARATRVDPKGFPARRPARSR
jgi:hypothetical protein